MNHLVDLLLQLLAALVPILFLSSSAFETQEERERERETSDAHHNRNDDRNEYYRLHSPTRAAKRPSMRRASVRSVTKETRGGFFFPIHFRF